MTEVKLVTLLIGAIGGLCSVVVWLAIYIRKMHKERVNEQKENVKLMVDVTKDFVQTTTDFKHSISGMVKSQDHLSNFVIQSQDRLANAINGLTERVVNAAR